MTSKHAYQALSPASSAGTNPGRSVFPAILLGMVALFTVLSGATNAEESAVAGQTWQVDMRGKPPYKRERTMAADIDLASMEINDQRSSKLPNAERAVVWQRDTTGRPPFSRQRLTLPVVDAAAMEIGVDDGGERPNSRILRGRPPFKRHR